MNHKLSIIIPFYNAERYIKRCIDSVLKLKLNKEIIAINDGSTDNSYNIVNKYSEKGYVQLYKHNNKGVSEARNTGLENCSGDVIAFVDSDDFLLCEDFTTLYEHLLRSDAEMAMGGVQIEISGKKVGMRQANKIMFNKIYCGNRCFANLMKSKTFTPLVFCYLFKKSLIDQYSVNL